MWTAVRRLFRPTALQTPHLADELPFRLGHRLDGETREALSPNVVWQCKRSVGILARLEERGDGEEIQRLTGMPLDPYFSASKLTWLLEEVPAVADARARGTLRLGTLDAFVSDRLGAGSATDPSTASRTQLQQLAFLIRYQ